MLGRILEHKITLALAVALLLGGVGASAYYAFVPAGRHFTAVSAAVSDIVSTVRAEGSVDSESHVSLSFRKAGTVTLVDATVGRKVVRGQILASLDNSDLQAELVAAKADVTAAAAETDASGVVSSASISLASALQDAYLKAEDAILNKTDTLFTNGSSANPQLVIPIDSYSTGLQLSSDRSAITDRLAAWKKDVIGVTVPSARVLQESAANLAFIQDFLNLLSIKTSRLSVGNSGLSQAQIDRYSTIVNAAEGEANGAATNLNSANQTYRSSAGALEKAQAAVAVVESQIANGIIAAPFDGVVASVSAKAGQAIAAGAPALDLIGDGSYKVDIMVPENEVGGVEVGDAATITFDAYGSSLAATGTVGSIDLSETMTNGVGAYKTTVMIDGSNARIRTGMTANVTIRNILAANALAVPSSAVIAENGSDSVLLEKPDGSFALTPVQTGASGDGLTQVLSGIAEGDKVAAFGASNR